MLTKNNNYDITLLRSALNYAICIGMWWNICGQCAREERSMPQGYCTPSWIMVLFLIWLLLGHQIVTREYLSKKSWYFIRIHVTHTAQIVPNSPVPKLYILVLKVWRYVYRFFMKNFTSIASIHYIYKRKLYCNNIPQFL